MKKEYFVFAVVIAIFFLTACDRGTLDPEKDFREGFTGKFRVYRLSMSGEVGGDSTKKFDGWQEIEVKYSEEDSALVAPGYDYLPTIWLGEKYEVALYPSGRFVEIYASSPLTLIFGQFFGEDSVYMETNYEQQGQFIYERLEGSRVE